jgi:hypothetical protein
VAALFHVTSVPCLGATEPAASQRFPLTPGGPTRHNCDMDSGDHGDDYDDDARLMERFGLWQTALHDLRNGDPRPAAELLRRCVPLTVSASHGLADLLDPETEWGAYSRLELKNYKSREFEKLENSIPIVYQVFDAIRAGDKRYLAVQKVAERIGKTERHVWGALRFYGEYYQGAVSQVIDIEQSGRFARDTTTVTIHSQTGSGAVLKPIVIRDDPDDTDYYDWTAKKTGTVSTFFVEETGKDYKFGDSVTFTDAVNGGKGSGRVCV